MITDGSRPMLRQKQADLDIQDLCGLLNIHWQIGRFKLHSASYTRIDQAFLVWGAVATIIFAVAQFAPFGWQHQAYLWTVLTVAGTVVMSALTRFWARVEQLSWVIHIWAALMLIGVGLTDLGIFLGWGVVLANLNSLWLAIVALGYFVTGFGMQSRTFTSMGFIHLLGILLLPSLLEWQFLFTGSLMGACLVALSQWQWDMRPPIASPVLSESERQFNHNQYLRRQSNA